jgi:lipoprotein-anchoring transpeptidase ErfK/SrfK
MPALRVLGGIFVAAAGVLAVTALVSERWQHSPEPSGATGQAPQVEFTWSVPAANTPNQSPRMASSGSEPQTSVAPVHHSHRHRAVVAEHEAVEAEHHRSKHHHRHSDVAHISASTVSEGSAPATPAEKSPPKNELAAVEKRLRNSLSDELFSDFRLFLYVSKVASGPLAQQMYVFRKESDGALDLLYDWPVSTGRDRSELNGEGLQLSTFTPTGYFKLDPHRFYRHHVSAEWREPMPFAMFFDWKERGYATGLAIHAATGSEIAELGTPASAGCIRLAPEAAETLFTLIRGEYRGLTPRFAVDHRTGTMSDNGIILHDADGRAELAEGYKVLVVIDNYAGRNIVAAMY